LEQNFGGTFMGGISEFRMYVEPLGAAQVQHNYRILKDKFNLFNFNCPVSACIVDEGDFSVTLVPAPTPTVTPTPSVTSTNTPTPSVTPTITPTASVTPTTTPTNTPTPTVTPTELGYVYEVGSVQSCCDGNLVGTSLISSNTPLTVGDVISINLEGSVKCYELIFPPTPAPPPYASITPVVNVYSDCATCTSTYACS
jgi:hypothetical protein